MAALAALGVGLAACTSPAPPDDSASTATAGTAESSALVQWSADPSTPTSAAPSPEEQWRQGVPTTPLAVPAEMSLTADRDDLGGMVGPAADRPAAVAAIRTAPDGRRSLQISTWDGAAWQPHPVDLTSGADPAQPQTVTIAGSSPLAAVAGWAWAAGSTSPFLLTSADRNTWAPVELPESISDYRLLAVDADGNRVIAAGQNARGATAVVRVDGSGDPTVTDLPSVNRRGSGSVIGLAVAGDTVLLAAGREVVRSVDGGRSWAEPTPITGSDWARVNGIAAITGGYLATGSDRVDESSSDRRATAWFSPDGVSWQAETLPEPEGFRKGGDDSWAGVPDAVGGDAFAVLASDSAVVPQVVTRRSTGEWAALGGPPEDVARGFGFGGEAVPAGADPAGPVLVGIQGALGLTLGQLTGGAWTTLSAPAAAGQVTSFRSAPSAEPQVWEADLQLPHFDKTEGVGWNRWLSLSSVGLAGDALVVLPPDPPEASRWTVRAYSGLAELAVISDFVQGKLAILGWLPPAPDQAWTPTTGFGEERWEQAFATGNIDGLWLIAGEHTSQVTSNATQQAMIWFSADGVTWARADGDFTQEGGASRLGGFCATPDGRRAAVGDVTPADGERHAALWIEQDGRWQRNELPTDPGWTSAFGSCVDIAGTLVINGSLGSGTAQWTWTPEAGFAEFEPSLARVGGTREFHTIAQVPGGYVALGRLDAAAFTGPVIWLSADGQEWQWLPLPVNRPDAWALAPAVGPDVLILSSSTTSAQAWRIPDIASVIAAMPAGS